MQIRAGTLGVRNLSPIGHFSDSRGIGGNNRENEPVLSYSASLPREALAFGTPVPKFIVAHPPSAGQRFSRRYFASTIMVRIWHVRMNRCRTGRGPARSAMPPPHQITDVSSRADLNAVEIRDCRDDLREALAPGDGRHVFGDLYQQAARMSGLRQDLARRPIDGSRIRHMHGRGEIE